MKSYNHENNDFPSMISRKENFFNPMLKICFIFIAQTCRLNPICPKFRTRETIPRSFRRKCRSRVQFIISMPIYILKCAETLILYILDNRSRYRDRKKKKRDGDFSPRKTFRGKIEILYAISLDYGRVRNCRDRK